MHYALHELIPKINRKGASITGVQLKETLYLRRNQAIDTLSIFYQ